MTETVNFPAVDGKKLVATLTMPKGSGPVRIAILTHGWKSARAGARNLGISERLERNGIGSLALDFRGHGDSEGDIRNATVSSEANDILSALDYLATVPRANLDKGVGIAGASIGASAALCAMALFPDRFRCGVLVSPRLDFTGVPKDMYSFDGPNGRIENHLMLPEGKKLDFYGLADRLKGKAILIIHGAKDKSIPIEQSRKLAAIDPRNFDLIEVPNGDHRMEMQTNAIVRDAAEHLSDYLGS